MTEFLAGAHVHETRNPELLRASFRLRWACWRERGLLPPGSTEDGGDLHDVHARHWVAVHDGSVLGAARLCVHTTVAELPDAEALGSLMSMHTGVIGSLSRMVIDPGWRGVGLPAKFDDQRLAACHAAGCSWVVAIAEHPSRIEALRSRGFGAAGQVVQRWPTFGRMEPAGVLAAVPATALVLDLR